MESNSTFLVHFFSKMMAMLRFVRLSKAAKLVLLVPHSNKDVETTFSMFGLNKTNIRIALALDGMLSSLMTVQIANNELQWFKWEPPVSVMKPSVFLQTHSAHNTKQMETLKSTTTQKRVAQRAHLDQPKVHFCLTLWFKNKNMYNCIWLNMYFVTLSCYLFYWLLVTRKMQN